MNLTPPPPDDELTVQVTQLEPKDKSDRRTAWKKFVDWLRTNVGLKPVDLAERWTKAKVRDKETDVDVKLLAARAQYELAAAEAYKIRSQADGELEVQSALAHYLRSQSIADGKKAILVQTLLEAHSRSPEECASDVHTLIQQIRLFGGSVEIDTGEDPPPKSPTPDESG